MKPIRLFLFPDVYPEDEVCIRSCISALSQFMEVQEIQVSKSEKNFFKKNQTEETSWIISRDWQHALHYLSAFSASSKVFVSVLSTQLRKATLWETWFQSLTPTLPPHIKLLAHSPLSYRFLKELMGFPDLQLEQLPIPVPQIKGEKRERPFTVGAYGSFIPNNNLHFFLTIGHYVAKKDHHIQFKIFGEGPLFHHLSQMAKDLKIESSVKIISTSNFSEPEFSDVVLYFPQKNDHFGPLLIAASVGAVPICGNISGVENYVRDSFNGFVFENEETRAISELVLTLKSHPNLCQEMGARFRRETLNKFSSAQVSLQYLSVFNGNSYQKQNYIRHVI